MHHVLRSCWRWQRGAAGRENPGDAVPLLGTDGSNLAPSRGESGANLTHPPLTAMPDLVELSDESGDVFLGVDSSTVAPSQQFHPRQFARGITISALQPGTTLEFRGAPGQRSPQVTEIRISAGNRYPA